MGKVNKKIKNDYTSINDKDCDIRAVEFKRNIANKK